MKTYGKFRTESILNDQLCDTDPRMCDSEVVDAGVQSHAFDSANSLICIIRRSRGRLIAQRRSSFLSMSGRKMADRSLRVESLSTRTGPHRGGLPWPSITISGDVTNRRIRGGLGHQGNPHIWRRSRWLGAILCSQRFEENMVHFSLGSLRDAAKPSGGVRKTAPHPYIVL